MRLVNFLVKMDRNENILVVKGNQTVYHGLVGNVPLSICEQEVKRQGFYSDGGTFLGIRFELLPDEKGVLDVE